MLQAYARAISLLGNLSKSESRPDVFLFTGVDRGAKIEAAFRLLKWALLNHAQDFRNFFKDGCSCESCNLADSGTHPDVIRITSNPVSIGDVLALKRRMSLAPLYSRHKTALIENGEGLKREGANALLKLLEEPRGKSFIILLAPSRSSLLQTISSRCSEVRFFSPSSGVNFFYPKDIVEENLSFARTFESAPVFKRFSVAKKYDLKNKDELVAFLDIWIDDLRTRLLATSGKNEAKLAKKLFAVKRTVLNTNANPRLILEELALTI